MSSSGTDKLSKQAMVQLLRSSTLLVPSEWFVFQENLKKRLICIFLLKISKPCVDDWKMALRTRENFRRHSFKKESNTLKTRFGDSERFHWIAIDDVLDQIRFYQMSGKELLQVEESVLGSRYSTTVQVYLNQAYRYQIIASARPPDSCPTCQPRDYTGSCVYELFYILCKVLEAV